MFQCKIETDGSAFCDPFTMEPDDDMEAVEIRRLLAKVSYELEHGATSGSIIDINGNKVGSWSR